MRKRIKIPSELIYLIAIMGMAFSVAMVSAADFGLSMIVAPAYLLSLKIDGLSFGVAEYIVQGILLIIFCIVMRRFRFSYLFAFISVLFYGAVLDLWRLIPIFNPAITPPGSIAMGLRIFFFALGTIITTFCVVMSFKTYVPPQMYDFFVSEIAHEYKLKLGVFKWLFDLSFLAVSFALTLIFFGDIRGIGWGTIVVAVVNGFLISLFSKIFDRYFVATPIFQKANNYFIGKPAKKQERAGDKTANAEDAEGKSETAEQSTAETSENASKKSSDGNSL